MSTDATNVSTSRHAYCKLQLTMNRPMMAPTISIGTNRPLLMDEPAQSLG
jgi:hypothetical protein